MTDAQSESGQSLIAERWRAALLQREPNLPRPVVDAMVQNVMKGALGKSLRDLEDGLIQLEALDIENLTGSEARTILAILTHLCNHAARMQASIEQLWTPPS